MVKKTRRSLHNTAPEFDKDKPRLINILAELCQCDHSTIEWDGEGSVDTVSFKTDACRYTLKLAKESVQGRSGSVMDFRVRLITGGE